MRIAVFSDTFTPQVNGIVTSIVNSSKILAKKNNKIHIFTIDTNGKPPIQLGKNIKITSYSGMNMFNYPDFEMVLPRVGCVKEVAKFKPDIIHIHTPTLLGWNGIILAKGLKIPKVGTYHTLLPGFIEHSRFLNVLNDSKKKRLAWTYGNVFYNRCDVVIAPSLAIKKQLMRHGLKKRVEVISNGVNLKKFYPTDTPKEVDLIYVGRISYEKNIDVVVKAVKIVKKDHPNVKMWIIGKGPDESKIRKLIERLHLTKNVLVKEAVDNSELIHYYNKAKIFVSASTIETEGITLLEAMACGIPLVGVSELAMTDLINGKNGLKSRPGNTKAFAANICTLLEDEEKLKSMGKHAATMAAEYDVLKSVEKLMKLYNRLRSKA